VIIGPNGKLPEKENFIYSWAKENIYGSRIMELGCSSGYAIKVLKDIVNLDYVGFDNNNEEIKFARENYNYPGVKFQESNIDILYWGCYNTALIFQVVDLIKDGKKILQDLKEYCTRILSSVNKKDFKEEDYPGYAFIDTNYDIVLLKWTKDDPTIIEKGKTYVSVGEYNLGSGYTAHMGHPLKIDNEKVDILLVTGLEKYNFFEGFDVIREWTRVLKKGGLLFIETPDFVMSCIKFLNSDENGRINMYEHFFGRITQNEIHKFLYTPLQLEWTLKQSGLINVRQSVIRVRKYNGPSMMVVAEKN
jgi:SAM-dependent methyltransferase